MVALPAVLGALLLPRSCPLCERPLLPVGGGWGRVLPPLCGSCARTLGGLLADPRPRCATCGRSLVSELRTCMDCRTRDLPFDGARVLFPYRGLAAALIGAYKFQGRLSLLPYLADLVASALAEAWPGLALVPVPFRRRKLVERGYDQVDLLCRALEGRGHEVLRLLERLPSGEQKRLNLEDRRLNALRAYRLKAGARPPADLVLLDDVLTTGATATACALALRGGGATRVRFLALAAD